MNQDQGFLASLYEFSFRHFITVRIVPVLFGIGLVGAVIATIGVIVAGFQSSIGVGILALILSPLVFLLASIAVRVYMELIIVYFRIAENTTSILDRMQQTP